VRRLAAAFLGIDLSMPTLPSMDIDKSMSKQSGGKPPHSKKSESP
jgi:hypothetical protein